jgi:hypothetical protein
MRQKVHSHLTYANVMVTILAFLVIGGGTALAAYVVNSNADIAPGTVSGHKPPAGDHSNIIAGSIDGLRDVALESLTGNNVKNSSLTGSDIKDRSGVDTCEMPLTAKFGAICAGSDAVARTWSQALEYCASYGLRLPSVSEATTLGRKYDVPGVSSGEHFWTDNLYYYDPAFRAVTMSEDGVILLNRLVSSAYKTVCVTDPSA